MNEYTFMGGIYLVPPLKMSVQLQAHLKSSERITKIDAAEFHWLTKSSAYLSSEDIHAIVGLRECFRYSRLAKENTRYRLDVLGEHYG